MAINGGEKIWFDGTLVDFADAKIQTLSHVAHSGSSVCEGLRGYDTADGSAVFRLDDHLHRLENSAKTYRMELPYGRAELHAAALETIRANRWRACSVRPIAFRGFGGVGVDPTCCPVDVAITVWERGTYLGKAALEGGVDVRVSSWTRPAPNTLPAMAKAGVNSMSSQLIRLEARADGYDEGIALDAGRYASEGSGENLFVVTGGRMLTPPLGASVLPGIARDCVITLARALGLVVEEHVIPREMLSIADDVFFTRSAAEVTPIRSLDRIAVGDGRRGPVTAAIQEAFSATVEGSAPGRHGWLTPVYADAPAPQRA